MSAAQVPRLRGGNPKVISDREGPCVLLIRDRTDNLRMINDLHVRNNAHHPMKRWCRSKTLYKYFRAHQQDLIKYVLVMGVTNPRNSGKRGEKHRHVRDSTKSNHGDIFRTAGAVDVDHLENEPSNTGSRATGMNTTKMLKSMSVPK